MPEGSTSEATTPKQETSLLEEKSPTHYQYKGQYIMTAVKSGLMIIDQYRAHTRILYEGYLDQMQKHRASSQKPLFPDTIHFSPADKVVAEAIMPELQNIGFELTPTAEGDYSITAVPSGLDGLDYTALLQDLVASAREKTTSAIDDIKFIEQLIQGVLDNQDSLDSKLVPLAPDWPIEQISRIDRAVLRLGLYELVHSGDKTPHKVVINEAVELAKEFGSDNSCKFVNGVLGTAYRTLVEDAEDEKTRLSVS